jgi:hypothetical protein
MAQFINGAMNNRVRVGDIGPDEERDSHAWYAVIEHAATPARDGGERVDGR